MIRCGVGITVLVRKAGGAAEKVHYHPVVDYCKAEQKALYLSALNKLSVVPWKDLTPDSSGYWLVSEHADEYAGLMPITQVFELHSLGVNTNRDEVVYDFQRNALVDRVKKFIIKSLGNRSMFRFTA